jgi:large repetitive protein
LRRFALLAAVVALLCTGLASSGSAASFDDTHPCPADGALLVCPSFQVGQPVSLQLRALAGCDLYRWEITNGSLPAGLSMNGDGLITGTPTATGSTAPWITVHDRLPSEGGNSWCIGDNHSEREFQFSTSPGLSIQDQSVPGGTINQPYSKTMTVWSITAVNPVQGGPTSATWSIASGSLPPGINFSSDGVLSGTPTATGSYTFVVRATGGGGTTDTETETLNVRDPMAATSPFRSTVPAKAEVGTLFEAHQSATGGSGSFTWTIASGALPAGVTLAADGTVSGTPSLPGRYAFVMRVSDTEGRVIDINSTLVVAKRLTLPATKLKAAKVGAAYRSKITFTGGVAPLTWKLSGKVPKGLKVTKTGLLLGTVKTAGNYRFTVTVKDALGVSVKKTLTLAVK